MRFRTTRLVFVPAFLGVFAACDSSDDGAGGAGSGASAATNGSTGATASTSSQMSTSSLSSGTGMVTPPPPSCMPAMGGGSTTLQAPTVLIALADRYEEGWLASPGVADLDGDGAAEIVVPREGLVVAWSADGAVKWRFDTEESRIWASPVIANFVGDAKLEVAVAARDKVFLLDAAGNVLPGFPVTWQNELRSLAAADLDGDGNLDLVSAPGRSGPTDVMNAWHADGSSVPGFPPNGTGVSGCDADDKCYLAGCYDQNIALGDLDEDGKADVFVGHDNAYASFHKGTGVAFDANPMFPPAKTPGVRYLHDLAEAQQGYSDTEETSLQAHFTNSAPAVADLDGDGNLDVILLGSVQNASQSDRLKGVGLWALHTDGSRLAGWESPFHAPDYVAGLWDFDGTNVVGQTNQVTVADIDPGKAGPELVFAGFDGRIHAVSATKQELWAHTYTTDPNVLTGGVVVGDLTSDGSPEIVFASYSVDDGKGRLFVLDAGGNELAAIPLPRRGAMPVPTLADVNGDGTVEIVVSLKDAEDKVESVRVYTVPGSATNCLLWPTGRANLLRNAWIP